MIPGCLVQIMTYKLLFQFQNLALENNPKKSYFGITAEYSQSPSLAYSEIAFYSRGVCLSKCADPKAFLQTKVWTSVSLPVNWRWVEWWWLEWSFLVHIICNFYHSIFLLLALLDIHTYSNISSSCWNNLSSKVKMQKSFKCYCHKVETFHCTLMVDYTEDWAGKAESHGMAKYKARNLRKLHSWARIVWFGKALIQG